MTFLFKFFSQGLRKFFNFVFLKRLSHNVATHNENALLTKRLCPIGQHILILIRLFQNFPAKETRKSSYFATLTRCLSYYESFFSFQNFFFSCEASNCLTHVQSLGKNSVLSHTRCWLRPDFLLIDVFGNHFEKRAFFKKFDDSCCFATSSISHVVLPFATMLKRPNDEALIYHTLMFCWVVLPFSDVFFAEESWLLLFRNLLFCSPYFDYYLRQKIGIGCDFGWTLSGYVFFTPIVFFIFCRIFLRNENLFSQ